jgi:uncharacterized protein YxjI
VILEKLESVNTLVVQQKKEWGEIITNFETRNRYAVMDSSGKELYLAGEEGGSTLLRIFLKALRPFTIHIMSTAGKPVLKLQRPFRFYFHKMDVTDASGRIIGTIQKRFSLLRRVYSMLDPSGSEMYTLYGPLLHPWTFRIQKNGKEIGKITKKWSGLLKEGFTDADNFGVTFPKEMDVRRKGVILGAVFLIDFVHFENKGNN